MARDKVDTAVAARQVDLRTNARRDFAQVYLQTVPEYQSALENVWLLRESLEGVGPLLGEGKGARALAKLFERRAVDDKAIYAVHGHTPARVLATFCKN
jgi:hypothetical protein